MEFDIAFFYANRYIKDLEQRQVKRTLNVRTGGSPISSNPKFGEPMNLVNDTKSKNQLSDSTIVVTALVASNYQQSKCWYRYGRLILNITRPTRIVYRSYRYQCLPTVVVYQSITGRATL